MARNDEGVVLKEWAALGWTSVQSGWFKSKQTKEWGSELCVSNTLTEMIKVALKSPPPLSLSSLSTFYLWTFYMFDKSSTSDFFIINLSVSLTGKTKLWLLECTLILIRLIRKLHVKYRKMHGYNFNFKRKNELLWKMFIV